jgi:CubicO group peptidase (beta-lactamase class C family)
MLERISAFVLALALPLAGFAQTASPESVGLSSERLKRVDALVQKYMDAGDITGAVTLVARNGKIAHLRAQGLRDREARKPMQKDTLFRIASMTKPVTAVAVMMLVEEGSVRLNDPVSRFIPAFSQLSVTALKPPKPVGIVTAPLPPEPPVRYTEPAIREVTVLDLLTHTSGILCGDVSNELGAEVVARRRELGLKWVEQLPSVPLEFQPGSKWAYSPFAGFDILSRIVEIVSGLPFDRFVEERIMKPIGARDTFFNPTPAQRERMAVNYVRAPEGPGVANSIARGVPSSPAYYTGPLMPRPDGEAMYSEVYFSGAAGLTSHAEAYWRFAQMLLNRGRWNGVQLISPRSAELIGSAYIPDTWPGRGPGEGFGLGVRAITDPVARRSVLSKGAFGWSGGFGTFFFIDPSKQLVAILLIQSPILPLREDFENAVMQAVLD